MIYRFERLKKVLFYMLVSIIIAIYQIELHGKKILIFMLRMKFCFI